MPMTIQEIKEYKDYYGLHDLETMSEEEFKKALNNEAFFWIDHHDRLRHQLSGDIIAMNKKQLDLIISHLKELKSYLR